MDKKNRLELVESSVLRLYKKLTNKEEIKPEEKKEVLERFYDLVNHKSGEN